MMSSAAISPTPSHADRVRAFYDAWNRRDWEGVGAGLADNVEWFHATRRELVRGVEAVVAMLKTSADAFPDARIDLRALHVTGDFVIAEWSAELRSKVRAKRGPLVSEVQVFADGKCVRGTSYGDVITMLLDYAEEEETPDTEHIVVDMPVLTRVGAQANAGFAVKRAPAVAPIADARARAS